MLTQSQGERRPPKLTKWEPKKWRPEYERMVYYSVAGLSNKQIGQQLGYTKEHVSNVLNLEKAEELRVLLLSKMRERAVIDIPSRLTQIAEKTVERIQSVIESDELFEKSPFAVIDRGMDVLKGLGHLRGGGNGAPLPTPIMQQNNFIGMSPELMEKFAGGLDVANQARELNKDVDFTAITSGNGTAVPGTSGN
jgi:hypothetical protein